MTAIVLQVIAGLALFLFALTGLSSNLESLAGEKMKAWLDRFTNNVFKGIISGLLITAALQSSSAVVIMTIALVSSSAMTFKQAMGVVMGANIGTTISSQIIAFDVGEWSAIPMILALPFLLFSKSDKVHKSAMVAFSTGLLFFALFTMENAVEPLKEYQGFIEWMKKLESPVQGALTGGFVTLVIQSSSATVAMAIKLCGQGLMELPAGIAVMLGAELGTCSDTLVATIGRTRPAVRTGFFHLTFSLITIILGLIFIEPFTDLVLLISDGYPIQRQVANAHILFNCLGVLICLPFIPFFEKLMYRIVPKGPNEV